MINVYAETPELSAAAEPCLRTTRPPATHASCMPTVCSGRALSLSVAQALPLRSSKSSHVGHRMDAGRCRIPPCRQPHTSSFPTQDYGMDIPHCPARTAGSPRGFAKSAASASQMLVASPLGTLPPCCKAPSHAGSLHRGEGGAQVNCPAEVPVVGQHSSSPRSKPTEPPDDPSDATRSRTTIHQAQ